MYVCNADVLRSTPFWQDVRIGLNNSRPYSNDRLVQPEHMRDNVAGLSVEYSKRYLDAAGQQVHGAICPLCAAPP